MEGSFIDHGHDHNSGHGVAVLGGNDHDHGHHGHGHAHQQHHQGVQFSDRPQGSASWTSALRAVKFEHMMQGINVTQNMLYLLLFSFFGLWLFVVYWVRHNEPLANQVLGTRTAHSSTGRYDRVLLGAAHKAVPLKTGPTTGMIYTPNAPATPMHPTAPLVAPLSPGAAAASPYAMSLPPSVPVTTGMAAAGTRGAYHVPVTTADGVRLKTVVNR